ncbi:MAG TPA: type VI secretion protein, partial [Devosia sp.]|nr:type VI secretion protein [Devosia sp.]
MNSNDDGRFRIRPGAPKQRGDAFISQVLRQTSKAGVKAAKGSHRPGARLGRGHTAARFTGASLTAGSRRVTIKTRLVNLAKAGPRST